MLAAQFHAAAAAAKTTAAVDEIARLTWRANAEGHILDAEAEAISEALRAVRAAFAVRGAQRALSSSIPPSAPALGPERPRSPDRQASLERRRRRPCAGAVPAPIAATFTQGENAALAVIARQCQRSRGLYTADRRHSRARRRQPHQRPERPAPGSRLGAYRGTGTPPARRCRAFPNVVKVISREWTRLAEAQRWNGRVQKSRSPRLAFSSP